MRNLSAYLFVFFSLFLFGQQSQAQKVGLVLSGGGAKGLAHVGVLKVLEQNGIPIDYIVGTSMGSVVGAMYSAGYSPDEIERIVLDPKFQYWVSGKQSTERTYNYLNADPSPSVLHLSVAVDSSIRVTPNLINDVNLNFVLAKLLAPAGAVADYNFDKLFVPFRCLAAEVFTRQQVIQKSGSISDAVRNSMAVPLVFRPIRNPDGRYLFDGGIYNNFPTDVMRKEFKPDVIIGVNVGDVAYRKYPFKRDDQLLTGTLVFLGANVADTTAVGANGVYIQPDLEQFGATDFDKVQELVEAGIKATRERLPQLQRQIQRRVDTTALATRRMAFQERAPKPVFQKVQVQGLRDQQNEYVKHFFRRDAGKGYTPDEIEDGYYRLSADDYFRNIFPRIRYDAAQQGYTFNVDANRNNNLSADVGFVISSRPVDNIYLGAEYRLLGRHLYTAAANLSLGRFYNAGQVRLRMSMPGNLPSYLEPSLTYNHWSFQRTSGFFDRNVGDALVEQRDLAAVMQLGVSPNYRSLLNLEGGYFTNRDRYANRSDITSSDVLDRTNFSGLTGATRFSRNSLNRKLYPTVGRRAVVSLRGVWGEEQYHPGTTALTEVNATQRHGWLQLSGLYERYYTLKDRKSYWGFLGQFVLSGQNRFFNYRSSLTTAPVFAPLVDSRTLFMANYRAPQFAAAGLRYSQNLFGKLEWRTEGFTHLNYRPWRQGNDQQAVRPDGFDRLRLTASTGFVYQTPVGPLAVHLIHYDDNARRWAVFGHIGYLLFRGRSLE